MLKTSAFSTASPWKHGIVEATEWDLPSVGHHKKSPTIPVFNSGNYSENVIKYQRNPDGKMTRLEKGGFQTMELRENGRNSCDRGTKHPKNLEFEKLSFVYKLEDTSNEKGEFNTEISNTSDNHPQGIVSHHTNGTENKKYVVHYLSTPATMRVSFQNGSLARMNRPKTAASVLSLSPRSECDRVLQVEHEPTRRHNLENHIPHKRTAKAPPWVKNIEPPMVPCVVAPGYLLSRSKSKFAVTIKDEFFDPVVEDLVQKKQVNDERDSLISQLQQQISDLTLYLEEERLNHRQTKQKAEDFLKDKVDELNNQHKDNIRDLEEDHSDEMEKARNNLNMDHSQYRATSEAQLNKMKKEIEFLQGAFESYKSSLHEEMNEKWKKREQDLSTELEEQKINSLHEFKAKMVQEKNAERISSGKEHARNIDGLRREHKKEIDGIIRKFSNVAADLERLKRTTAELKEVKAEFEQVKQAYDSTCQQMANTTRDLADARVRLMSYEEQFEYKVSGVDEKYKKKINELMTQNIELRRLYVEKCEELYDEKMNVEMVRVERVSSAKEVMHSLIKSKHKAKVSLSPAIQTAPENLPVPERPGSAPITRSETDSAQYFAGKFEDILRRESDTDAILSPSVILPEDSAAVERMRAELMADIMEKAHETFMDDEEEEDEEEYDDDDF